MSLGLPFIQPRRVLTGGKFPVSGLAPVLWLRRNSGMWRDLARTQPALVGDPVATWEDQSGRACHADQATTAKRPVRTSRGLVFDGSDDWLDVAGAKFKITHVFAVMRAFSATWTSYSAPLGSPLYTEDGVANGRDSPMIFSSGQTGFWGDVIPRSVSRNGVVLSSGNSFSLAPITDRMILSVGTAKPTLSRNYRVAACEGYLSKMEIEQIIGLDRDPTATEVAQITARLASEHQIAI